MLRRSTVSIDFWRRACTRITAKPAMKRIFDCSRIAYDVLADPRRRAEYDATRSRTQAPPEPLATSIDFMDELEGELNRRLAVLAVLYYRRRTNPTFPEVTLSEIEERMGFPRDYLDFTLWYLQRKGYVSKADNAQYTLTVDGVDFVETQRANMPTLNKLLTSGSGSSVEDLSKARYSEEDVEPEASDVAPEANAAAATTNRRLAKTDLYQIRSTESGPTRTRVIRYRSFCLPP